MYRTRNNRPSRFLMTGTAQTYTALGSDVVNAQSQPADFAPAASEVQSADPNLHYARHQREYANWLIESHLAAQSGQSND